MLGLESAQLLAGDHVGHGAAGMFVRNDDGLAGIQNGRGFGHEMDAAEHDAFRIDLGGLAGEFKGVAVEVSDVLDVGQLVVVGQDDRLAFVLQFTDFIVDVHGKSPRRKEQDPVPKRVAFTLHPMAIGFQP